MNALKKIFLLTLLSVFFLSAFSQTVSGTEILGIVTIDRSVNQEFDTNDIGQNIFEETPNTVFGWPWWWMLYREVVTQAGPGYMNVTCTGYGYKLCIPLLNEVMSILKSFRGLDTEVVASTFEGVILESEELASTGTNIGSISRKIAIPGDKINYVLMQMNWNYEPKNPYNGQAEIIISKTDNFGF